VELREEDFCPGDERILACMRGLLYERASVLWRADDSCPGDERIPVLKMKRILSWRREDSCPRDDKTPVLETRVFLS
jgi:hypothetical protein